MDFPNFVSFSIISIFTVVGAYPIHTDKDSVDYLTRFGYLSKDDQVKLAHHAASAQAKIREGLKSFQYFAGLPKTGVLDKTTLEHMNLPRCGNTELEKVNRTRRRKRFVLDSKWEKTYLTYTIINYPTTGPNNTDVDAVVQSAFKFWTDVANVHVVSTRSKVQKADIEISFVRGTHNDGISFDVVENVGRVVAHAWKPFNTEPLRGDMHFNDEVTWGIDGKRPWAGQENVTAHDLLRTAIHEAGHALGLEHSPHPEAMMYFAVTGHLDDLKLTKDDVQGIQELYGRRSNSDPLTRVPLTTDQGQGSGRRPIVVPSGTPQANQPWECYRFQEQSPRDTAGIQRCYQGFYREVYQG